MTDLVLIPTSFRPLPPPEGDVGDRIPCVVDADEEQQERSPTKHEQRRRGIALEQDRSHQKCRVCDERKRSMPEPVLEHWHIVSLPPRMPNDHHHVRESRHPAGAEGEGGTRERRPRCTQDRRYQ